MASAKDKAQKAVESGNAAHAVYELDGRELEEPLLFTDSKEFREYADRMNTARHTIGAFHAK